MKRLFLVALISIFALAGTAQFVQADEGDKYVGVKTGIMSIDVYGIDDITALGFLVGFGLTPEVSLEGELNIGISGGEIDTGVIIIDGEFDIWTLAAYAVYRHPINDTISLKGKAGLLYESVEFDMDTILGSLSGDDTDFGVSFGAGATIKVTDLLSVDVEYTIIETDVDYLSAGLNYKF